MGLKALTNFRMNVLKMSRSSKLLSVLGTSEIHRELLLFLFLLLDLGSLQDPGPPLLTQHSQPAGDGPVHLVQDENDHQVDDGRRGFDRQLHVAAGDGVGAHVEGGRGGDAVENDPEHKGEGHADLRTDGSVKADKPEAHRGALDGGDEAASP